MFLRKSLAALTFAAAASPLLAAGSSLSPYAPYSLTVLVDGSPAPEYSARGRIYVEALKGRTFSLRISNPTSERVAVALSVDGRNVIDAKRTSSLAAAKWILSPGETAEIPGWQISGDSSRRFFFTETRHSYAKWLGDTSNTGVIEAVFYREKRAAAAVPPRPRPWWQWNEEGVDRKDESGAGGKAQNLPRDREETAQSEASVAPSEPQAGAPPSSGAVEKRRQREAPSPLKESDTYAATGIGERTSFPVQWTTFDEDPTPAARVSLRYEYHAELVRLGVIPREDDLYARDRGRGFEREYAPDPYRGH